MIKVALASLALGVALALSGRYAPRRGQAAWSALRAALKALLGSSLLAMAMAAFSGGRPYLLEIYWLAFAMLSAPAMAATAFIMAVRRPATADFSKIYQQAVAPADGKDSLPPERT